MSSNQEINVDLSYLKDVSGGNAEFIADMIDIFIAQTPVYVEQLTKAVNEKDWKQIAQLSHKIKPTLAFIGVNSERDVMAQIEDDARNERNYEGIVASFTKSAEVLTTIYSKLEAIKHELIANGS